MGCALKLWYEPNIEPRETVVRKLRRTLEVA